MTVAEMEANTSAEDSIRNKIATPVTFENHAKRYLRSMIFDAYKTDSYYNILSKGGPLNIEMNRLMAASMVKEYDIRQSIPGLVVPTLVITGRQDPSSIFSSVELEKLNHRYLQLHWIEKCGHYPFVEHPNTFFAIVKSFLTE